jgi:two-component system, cell cycle sensor histidine kinase and response regulator CckA
MEHRRVAYETARLRLARYQVEGSQARARAAEHAAQVCAEALGVERVGVWLLQERAQRLVCASLYNRTRRERSAGQTLSLQAYPQYLRALAERRIIAAEEAQSDPSTREFAESYLRPAGISSLLDAPVIRDGSVFAVVRCEHVGSPRAWKQTDLEFASAVADSLALTFEQADRLELEAALQEQAEQRQESQKMEALGRIASAVAHDFNNLLSTIALTAATIEPGMSSADLATTVGEIEEAVMIGKGLTKQLLAFGKQRADAELGAVDLRRMLDRMMPMLRTAVGRAIILTLEASPTHTDMVMADPSQLEQVILNLCVNARDAVQAADARSGEITLTLRDPRPGDEVAPGTVLLEVRDNGVGMDEDTLARVFEPFFSTKRGGTGLGLATVYGIVKRCGGVVRALSEPGAGTTMQVALPCAS